MASQATETQGLQKSKRPSDSAFKQQRLPAWQPVLTARTVLPTFFVVGVIFLPIGVSLLLFSNSATEYVIDYTNCVQVGERNKTCAEYLTTHVSGHCDCSIDFVIEKDMVGTVYMYYGLTNYYQNHRRYVKSRDDEQLLGNLASLPNTDCEPFAYDSNNVPIAPCGAIANSLFNDTLTLNMGSTPVGLLSNGIAWPSDLRAKFHNPPNMKEALIGYTKPKFWQKNITELENGFENEDLIVWMRTAALPSFRKLYRRVNQTMPEFKNGLKAGNYTLNVVYQYPVTSFDGTKKMILATTSVLGGKNPFLGIAYIVVGCICITLGLALLFIHLRCSKSNTEMINVNPRTPYS